MNLRVYYRFIYIFYTRKDSKGNTVKDYTLALEISKDSKDKFLLNSIKDVFQHRKGI